MFFFVFNGRDPATKMKLFNAYCFHCVAVLCGDLIPLTSNDSNHLLVHHLTHVLIMQTYCSVVAVYCWCVVLIFGVHALLNMAINCI